MIPALAAVSTVASLISGLLPSRQAAHPPTTSTAGAEFKQHLDRQVGRSLFPTAADQTSAIQVTLARQQALGGLKPDQQMALARLLVNQAVQVVDPAGNSVTGTVSEARLVDGQAQVVVQGVAYPISSVQAVLQGLPRM